MSRRYTALEMAVAWQKATGQAAGDSVQAIFAEMIDDYGSYTVRWAVRQVMARPADDGPNLQQVKQRLQQLNHYTPTLNQKLRAQEMKQCYEEVRADAEQVNFDWAASS